MWALQVQLGKQHKDDYQTHRAKMVFLRELVKERESEREQEKRKKLKRFEIEGGKI